MVESLSIVIPLWNGSAFIESALEALQARSEEIPGPLEVIVVDNGSKDGSPERVEAMADVTLLRSSTNLGFAGACNRGLRAAGGDGIVLLNQDTVVHPGWLGELCRGLSRPDVGIVGALARYDDGRIQHAGGCVDWPLGVARHLTASPQGMEKHELQSVEYVSGLSLALRREVMEQIGFLDEGFWPGYYEDVDYCFRARHLGFGVFLATKAQLTHRESGSFGDTILARWARLRGRLRFCLKAMAPEKFVQSFLPAEEEYRASVLAGDREGKIARAYLEAAPMLVQIWGNEVPKELIIEGVNRLGKLYGGPYAFETRSPVPPLLTPILTPSRFDDLPLLGGPLHAVRRALHQLVIFYVEQKLRALEIREYGEESERKR